jgi:tRNA threonylcarbamoyl adenosine modification protein (Sua5/YciO/YrdC/YwlC family)
MFIELHHENPETRILKKISEDLKNGEVYIFPTDTVYAILADSNSKSGVEKIYKLKEMNKHKPLTVLCRDISTASEFIEQLPNEAYRLMKKITPGPYTFVFKSNKNLPKYSIINQKTKTIGIRFPSHIYLSELLKIHDSLITTTSVVLQDEFLTNISEIQKEFESKVKGIVNGGNLKNELSTILDFTNEELVIERIGKGYEILEPLI